MRTPAIIASVTLAWLVGLAGTSQARIVSLRVGGHEGKAIPASWRGPRATMACDATQTITIINQANVRRAELAPVERAMQAQSVQLRAAWQTPCITFGAGGWPIYLKGGGGMQNGMHACAGGLPYALVYTAGLRPAYFSSVLSHELVEMLVNPCSSTYTLNQTGYQLEVADPVDAVTYRLDGVNVADFVLPVWYAGALAGNPCVATLQGVTCNGPLLAPADAAPPWDQAQTLRRPWQTRSLY